MIAREQPTPLPVVYLARGGMIDGSARQLIYLLRHMDQARYAPLVVLDLTGPLVDEIEAMNVPVRVQQMRPWRSLRGLPWRRFDAAAIAELARSHGTRLVHCSDTWRTPYAKHVARKLGVPLVVHVRGPTTPRDLEKNHCLSADAMIAIAERYRSDIAAADVDAERIQVIDDAVDISQYRVDPAAREAFRRSLGIAPGARVAGMVGRLEPLKRCLECVDVIDRLQDREAVFLFVGSTQREEYVRVVRDRIEELGLSDRVRLIGRRDDVRAVLNGLDVLITLAGGSVMFEAMACSVPVLSVRADGRHSQHTIDNETARCVTTDSPAPAAAALDQLFADVALRNRLGEAGRRCVSDRLDPGRMAQRTMAIYDDLLAVSI